MSEEEKQAKKGTSYRLSGEARDLIKKLRVSMGLSDASVIEVAVRDLAQSRGLWKPPETS